MQETQLDLAYAVSLCSQFLAKLTATYIGLAKQILQYLKGSTDLEITYYCNNTKNLFVYTNANY